MDDRVLGAVILLGSIIGIAVYFWLVFLSPWWGLIIKISAFFAVAAVLVIVAWIGYTLATTPPPEPLEDFSDDLEDTTVEETPVEDTTVEETPVEESAVTED